MLFNNYEIDFEENNPNKYSIIREKKFKKQLKKVDSYDFTKDEITEFLCKNQSQKSFVTSPYSEFQFDEVTKKPMKIQINEQHYNMSCEVFTFTNSSGHVNVMQHFFLNTTTELKPSFVVNFRNESNGQLIELDQNPGKMNLTINRTHGNNQYFVHSYFEHMNYLPLMRSLFYHHQSNDSNAVMLLNDYATYENFIKNANTTLLYSINHWKLGASTVKEISMNAKSKIINYEGLKV